MRKVVPHCLKAILLCILLKGKISLYQCNEFNGRRGCGEMPQGREKTILGGFLTKKRRTVEAGGDGAFSLPIGLNG